MRIILISDTHSLHRRMKYDVASFIKPNEFNVLIHAGDCTNIGSEPEVNDFISWYNSLEGFNAKIFIAGNHDLSFETKAKWLSSLIDNNELQNSNTVYLEDETLLIQNENFSKPVKVYGSPWQPEFYDWAFNLPRNGVELETKWEQIPDDVNILITHGPPYSVRDYLVNNKMVGCEKLIKRLESINPQIHVFGHIHNSYGVVYRNDTLFVNASICTEDYEPINKPIVVDLLEDSGTFKTEYIF